MGTKVTVSTLAGRYASIAELNANFAQLADEFDKCVYRDGTVPNVLTASLDVNSQRLLNLLDATTAQEPVTLSQLNSAIAGLTAPTSHTGLTDLTTGDPHTQYLLASSYGGRAVFTSFWTAVGGGPSSNADAYHTHALGAASDHGTLTGLADDDHAQYHNDSRGDTRYQGQIDNNAEMLSTGLLTGGVLSVNGGDNTKFDISAGTGIVVDHSTSPPTITEVSFGPFTAQTVTNLATQFNTDIAIDVNGAIVQATSFTRPQLRQYIFLGGLDHNNKTTIDDAFPVTIPVKDVNQGVRELAIALGDINVSGNVYSANGANLNINKTSGSVFSFGRNFQSDVTDPHHLTTASGTALTFGYVFNDGAGNGKFTTDTTSIDPNNYDDGSGTLASVTAAKWTIQRILFFPNANKTFVQYGTATYTRETEALDAVPIAQFVSLSGIRTAVVRGYIVVQQGETDLTNATFLDANKLGNVASISSGIETTFTALLDTPSSYSGQTLKAVRVNAGETALEFYTPITDHGGLTGLADDDHTQYLLADGTRPLGGTWNLQSNILDNAGIIKLSELADPGFADADEMWLHAEDESGISRLHVNNSTIKLVVMEDNYFIGKNTSGAPITIGTPVYITGAAGQRPTISPADASTDNHAVGLTMSAVANNGWCRVMTMGTISGVDTSTWAEGTILWLAAGGGLTSTEPVHPVHNMRMGEVTFQHAVNGIINVSIHGSYRHSDGSHQDTFIIGSSATDRIVFDITASALTASRTFTFPDAAGTIALQSYVTAAVAAHEAAGDPHPQYLTQAEGDALYSVLGHTHTFLSLTDTPASYATHGLKAVRVNAAATALEFIDLSTLYDALGAAATVQSNLNAHTGDSTIHFTVGSISHTAIADIGVNSHATIDTHIADSTKHFTVASIDHTAILNIGSNTHAQIDTHIADGTTHFTVASIDHGSIAGLADDDHTQYFKVTGRNGEALTLVDGTGADSVVLGHDGSYLNITSANTSAITTTTPIEFNGGVMYDPSSTGAGSDTAATVALAIASTMRIVGHTTGYIRTLLKWTASGPIEIGHISTALITDIDLIPGNNGKVNVKGNSPALRVYDPGLTDYVAFTHDGTDFNITGTNTVDINIAGISGNVNFTFSTSGNVIRMQDGTILRIYDATDTDFAAFSHDGTDFYQGHTNTSNLVYQFGGTTKASLTNQGGLAVYGTSAGFSVADRTTSGSTIYYRTGGTNALWDDTDGDFLSYDDVTKSVYIPHGRFRFPSTSSLSSDVNTMDYYKEGTFTPAFTGATTSPSGYLTQTGYYTRIGDVVFFWFRITMTGAATSGSGALSVTGLPFTAYYWAHAGVAYAGSWDTNRPDVGYVQSASIILVTHNATSFSTMDAARVVANTDIIMSGTYKTVAA